MKNVKSISVSIFLILIFSISIINALKPDVRFSESENRYLETKPKFSISSFLNGEYMKKSEKYMKDQFIFKNNFISMKTQFDYLTGKKDSNGIYFASDGYLIDKHDANKIDLNLMNKNINYLNNFIKRNTNKLGKNNVTFMLVPTASEVLSDKLPKYATQFNQDDMIELVKSNIKSGVFIDLRDVLKQHKNEYIYYKTDHHWTTNGAFYAYKSWCEKMDINKNLSEDYNIKKVSDSFFGTTYSKARLFNTKPDSMYAYIPNFYSEYIVDYNMGEKISKSLYEESYLNKRDKYSYYLGGNNPIVKITSQNKNNKKLLIVKDSYAHSFAPFVANDFNEVHMLDLRYLNMNIDKYIDENQITDIIVLYNTINFAKENTIINLK